MEHRLKVSVIIPTYKPQEYLQECLSSLERQTMSFSDFEVILVLNGELDPYQAMIGQSIRELRQGFPIVFLITPIPGVSHARNQALDIARGEYICFIDDDDYVSDTYLEDLYSIAQPTVIPLCRPVAFYDNMQIDPSYRITQVYDKFKESTVVPFYNAKKYFSGPCMKLIPRDVIDHRRFDTGFSVGEDSLFMFLISDRFRSVVFASPRAIYYRRIREGSASTRSRSFKEKLKNSLRIMGAESKIVLKAPRSYNLYFFVTRLLGAAKAALLA